MVDNQVKLLLSSFRNQRRNPQLLQCHHPSLSLGNHYHKKPGPSSRLDCLTRILICSCPSALEMESLRTLKLMGSCFLKEICASQPEQPPPLGSENDFGLDCGSGLGYGSYCSGDHDGGYVIQETWFFCSCICRKV